MAQFRSQDPSIAGLLRTVWSHKAVMALSLAVGIGAVVGLYLVITPVFEASSTVLVSQAPSENGSRLTEMVSSQARVAESQEVLGDAVSRVGLHKFGEVKPFVLDGLGGWLRQVVSGKPEPEPMKIRNLDIVAGRLARSVSVRTEPNSEIIRISFKHSDPVLAAEFTNAITSAFIARQLNLTEKPGAVDFFRDQRSRFDGEVQARAAALEEFARKESIYSVQDQRGLLLRRASELSAALSLSRITAAEKQGQRAGLVGQLRLLKPVTQSPFVTTLVDNLSGESPEPTARSRPGAERGSVSNNPPLLMVRVYQDAMVSLFKVNADIAGLEGLAAQQQHEMNTIDGELAALSTKEAEFERRKRELSLATFNAELYAKRAVEEQINTDLRTAKLTNVRVVQSATIPLRAAFPNGIQFLALGVAAGLILGVGLSLLLESRKAEPPSELSSLILGANRLPANWSPEASSPDTDGLSRRQRGPSSASNASDQLLPSG